MGDFQWSDLIDIPFSGAKSGYDRAFGPTAEDKARQDYLNSMGGRLAGTQAENDARRKEALKQSLAFFGPVSGVLSKMYGTGAGGPGVDVDALFGTGPAADGSGGPLAPGWNPLHQTHTMFDNPPLPPGWDPRRQTHPMFGKLADGGRTAGGQEPLVDPPARHAPTPRPSGGWAGRSPRRTR